MNNWSRTREVRFLSGIGLAFTRTVNIGDKNRRQGIKRTRPSDKTGLITLGRIALDGHLSTVHVHLAVADLVEPRPSQQSLARGRIRGHLEFVLLRKWAAAEHRLDNMEGLALIVGERDLAGSSTVGRTAGEFHLILVARGVIRDGVECIVRISLARIVGPIRRERIGVGVVLLALCVLIQRAADGVWLAHLHVTRHAGSQEAANQKKSLHDVE